MVGILKIEASSLELLLVKVDSLTKKVEELSKLAEKSKLEVYNNEMVMNLLNIKEKTLRQYRDNGYLGYCRRGDKYFYTRQHIEEFLANCHYAPFAAA